MAMDSPLFLSKVECPVCGTVNEFETIRVGAYTEGDRMTDFCPTFYKWRNPKYQKYNPLLFFTATCSNCSYTREFNNSFKDWTKDNNFRTYRLKTIKEKHMAKLSSPNSFLRVASEVMDSDTYPTETAIIKLMLAIYDELLNEHPSNLDLGRFYLRIAWLFRHMAAERGSEGSDGVKPGHLGDIERTLGDLRTSLAAFGRNIGYLENAVSAHFESHEEDGDRSLSQQRFVDQVSGLHGCEQEAGRVLGELEALLGQARFESGGSSGGGGRFHDFDSFEEFLVKLLRIWEGVPRNELEATRFAVRYYISAFESGKGIAKGNQSIQAAYLIAELSRRIEDHDTARQYFNNTIKMGQSFINEIRGDRTRTALARKILEMAMTQGKKNLAEAK